MIHGQHLWLLRGLYKSHYEVEFKRIFDTTTYRTRLTVATGYNMVSLTDTIGESLSHAGCHLNDDEHDKHEALYLAPVARLSKGAHTSHQDA